MRGKTIIITGANRGIGYETALALSRCGARIIMACRNITVAEEAKGEHEHVATDAFHYPNFTSISKCEITQVP